MRYLFAAILGIFVLSRAGAQTPAFSFECFCGYVSLADSNCDICTDRLQSRLFKGLLIRRYGTPFKWIEAPYLVRFKGNAAEIQELVYPNPESIMIDITGTPFDSIAQYQDSIKCPCSGSPTVFIAGPGIVISGDTISAVDTSYLNELQTIDTFMRVGDTLLISLSLEDSLHTLILPNGSTAQIDTFQLVGNILGISLSGDNVPLHTVDLSQYAQTLSAGGAGPTSYTIDLSNSGGSVTLTEGANIDLTRSGNTITIAAASGGGTDLYYSGTSSPVTLNSSSGNDVTVTAGTNITLSATSSDLTINATEVDGSTSNELQTISAGGAGPTSYTVDLSNGGGSVTLAEGTAIDLTRSTNTITITNTGDLSVTNEAQTLSAGGTTAPTINLSTAGGAGGGTVTLNGAGIITLNQSGGTITITGTEVDGSTSNEIQTLTAGGAGPTSYTVDLSLGGGSVTLTEGTAIDLSRTGNTVTIANTGDVSNSNELQTYSHAGTTTYTNTLSGGGGSFSITGAGINVVSQTAGAVTITGTEVDGSVTNEAQTLSAGGTTAPTINLSTAGGAGGGTVTLNGAGIITLNQSGGTITITGTEVDGSTTNELQTISAGGAGPTSYTVDLSNGGGNVTFAEGGIIDLTRSTNTITISATEVDGSTTNELQTYSHAGTTTYTNTLSGGGGSFSITGAGINVVSQTAGAVTITGTEVDGSTSNELQALTAGGAGPTSYTLDLSLGGGSVTLAEGSGIDLARSTNTITITNTGDLSVTNEAQTLSAGGTTSPTITLSQAGGAGGGTVTYAGGGIITLNQSGGTITITGTEVDGSTTNEIQTLTAGGAGPTSYTLDLSLGGGSVTLAEGANVDLTRTANTITIASALGPGTNLSYTGASSPVTLNSSTGTDVTITAGGIITFSATSGNLTITGTEVDGSVTNEAQTLSAGGTTSPTVSLSTAGGAGGGTVTYAGAGIITLNQSGGTITITGTEVDGSTSNELQALSAGGAGPTAYTLDLSLGGGSVTLTEGSAIDLSRTGNNITITNTGDLSVTNEAQTLSAGGTTSPTITLSQAGGAGGGTVTYAGAGIITLNQSGGTITITGTEVDGSTSNELQALTAGGAGPTSYTLDLSNGGGSVTLAEGSGIDLARSTNTITITNTGDLSVTNEAQTLSAGGTTSPTITLSQAGGAGGGTVTYAGAGIVTLNQSGGTITITGTEVDGSTTNELQAISAGGAGPTSYTLDLSNGGGSVTLTEGGIVDLTRSTNTITVSATEVDGSVTNEAQSLSAGGTTSPTVTLSQAGGAGGGTITYAGAGIITLNQSGGTITITGTEVDGSTSNEIQALTAGGAGPTSYTLDLSLGGGSVTLAEGSGIDLTRATNTITVTNTGDLSATNEAQTLSAGGTTSPTVTLSTAGGAGGGTVTYSGAGIVTLNQSGGTITITGTEVDGSTTNEIQTLTAGGAGPTSYTLDLSNGGGSVTLAEGSGINLTRSANTITIANTFTDENGIYGEGGVAGTGDGTLPPGGSIVTIPGQWQPLSFSVNPTAGQVWTALKVTQSVPNDDTRWSKLLVGKAPADSMEIYLFDGTGHIKHNIGLSLESSGPIQYFGNEHIHFNVASSTTLPYIYGATSIQGMRKISGTSNGQILVWNQTGGYWEIGAPPGGGTVTGTGSAGQSAFWTGASSQSGDNNYWWDNTNKRLGIGTAAGTPTAAAEVRTNALGTTQTTTSGLALTNTTSASVGAQQISPALRWSGAGWKTTATAASQPVEFRAYVTPVQGTTAPTGFLGIGSAINGTWTNNQTVFNSDGAVGINTTTFSTSTAKLNVYAGTGFVPFAFNTWGQSDANSVVYGQLSNTTTTGNAFFSLNEQADDNTIRAGLRRFNSAHTTRPNELNLVTIGNAPITLATQDVVRYTMSGLGTAFQPGKFGAGTATESAVNSTLTSGGSFATAYLETVGAPTFDETKHTVIYTASVNISWTLPSAASCSCAGRIYVLHHAGTAGTITLSQSITKGNGGNFSTLTAGQWAQIYYGSSSIRGYLYISL